MNKITVNMLVLRVKDFFSSSFAQNVDATLTHKYHSQVAMMDDTHHSSSVNILKHIRNKLKKAKALDPFKLAKQETYQSYEEFKKSQHMSQLISLNSTPIDIQNGLTG